MIPENIQGPQKESDNLAQEAWDEAMMDISPEEFVSMVGDLMGDKKEKPDKEAN